MWWMRIEYVKTLQRPDACSFIMTNPLAGRAQLTSHYILTEFGACWGRSCRTWTCGKFEKKNSGIWDLSCGAHQNNSSKKLWFTHKHVEKLFSISRLCTIQNVFKIHFLDLNSYQTGCRIAVWIWILKKVWKYMKKSSMNTQLNISNCVPQKK